MIPADVVIHPDTLNTKSKGKWITAYIELPVGMDVNDIDVSTVTLKYLDGTLSAESSPTGVGDFDGDGIPDRMVKFKRADLIELLSGDSGLVSLTVSGEVAGCGQFAGEDFIRIK